ncbi:hypothetical protein ABK040_007813 [Willaertia magna]
MSFVSESPLARMMSKDNNKSNRRNIIASPRRKRSTATSSDEEIPLERSEFVYHKLIKSMLSVGDFILIIVPEEFEILQTIDPMLHGKVGVIIKLEEEEVQVAVLKNRKGECDEKINVPRFCCCLQLDVFNRRREQTLASSMLASINNVSPYNNCSNFAFNDDLSEDMMVTDEMEEDQCLIYSAIIPAVDPKEIFIKNTAAIVNEENLKLSGFTPLKSKIGSISPIKTIKKQSSRGDSWTFRSSTTTTTTKGLKVS